MKKSIVIAVIVILGWCGNYYYKQQHRQDSVQERQHNFSSISESQASENNIQFTCDGRTYCSQMHSCAEAKFFLKNCPNVKMDGNHDGIPCEKQWCK
jgi:hypothetical protein